MATGTFTMRMGSRMVSKTSSIICLILRTPSKLSHKYKRPDSCREYTGIRSPSLCSARRRDPIRAHEFAA